MKLQLLNKLKTAAICFVFTLITLGSYAQDRLVIDGGWIRIINDTLKVHGSIVVNKNNSNGENIHNAGVIYITDSLINNVTNLFNSSSNPSIAAGDSANPVGEIIFSGTKKQYISGKDSNHIYFNDVDLNNPNNLNLKTNVNAFGKLLFQNGNLNLNGYNIDFFDTSTAINRYSGVLISESDSHRIIDSKKSVDSCGYIRAYQPSIPSLINVGNLGAEISRPLGTITVERGHVPLFVIKDSSFAKFYNFYSDKPDTSIHASILLHYNNSDFRDKGYDASALSIFSTDLPFGSYFKMHKSIIDSTNHTVSASNLNLLRRYMISNSSRICEDTIRLSLPPDIWACAGDSILLDPQPKNNIGRETFYEWYKGPAILQDTTGTLTVSPEHKKEVDTFVVKVSNEYGCKNYDTVLVHTSHLPSVAFINNSFYCKNDSIHFKNTSSIDKNALHYFWDFGDSTISIEKNPAKKYGKYGEYLVTLRCISDSGCSNKIQKQISVFENPKADFKYEKVCHVNTINCTNTSKLDSGSITQSIWNFSGSKVNKTETQAMDNISHSFAAFGTYPVKLTVVSYEGNCSDSITKNVVISAYDAPDFAVSNNCSHDSAHFRITSHINSGSATYTWYFDGSFISYDKNPSFYYASEGEYNVSLNVQNNGCTSSITKKITVHPPPNADFTYGIPCSGNVTQFHNNSEDSLKYFWSFDGNASSDPNPSFFFNTVGQHEAKLQVTSSLECTSSIIKNIEVLPAPSTNFDYSVVCFGDSTHFINNSSTPAGTMSFLWNLNNESTSELVNPGYVFKDSVNVNTELKVTSDNGCSTSITKKITVYPLPHTDLDDSVFTCGSSLPLQAEEANAIYDWSNGVHDRDNLITATDIYYLTVTNSRGCIQKDSSYVVLNSQFNVNIGDSSSGCETYRIKAHNYRSTYLWSTGSTESYIDVSVSGTYKVEVTDINNCKDSDSAYVRIDKMPIVNLGKDTSICRGNSLTLNAGNSGTSYLWSDKSKNSTFQVNDEGTYFVGVENGNCFTSDTIKIGIISFLKPGFGKSITACDETYLNAGNNGCSYFWSTSDTTQIIKVNKSDDYWVQIDKFNCRDTESVHVNILSSPELILEPDSVIHKCNKDTAELKANDLGPEYSYKWNNSISGPSLKTTAQGTYYLDVHGPNGCSSSDTILVYNYPLPEVDLKNVYYLCEKTETLDAGEGYASYSWGSDAGRTGSNRTLDVSEQGNYWVSVNTPDGCHSYDTTMVRSTKDTVNAMFLVAGAFEEADTAFRAGDTVCFTNLSFPANAHFYWDFGDNSSSYESQPRHIFYSEGTYTITLTTSSSTCSDTLSKIRTVKGIAGNSMKSGGKNKPKDDKNNLVQFLYSKLYPNPATEHIMLEFQISVPSNIILYILDINGRAIHFEKLKVESVYNKNFNLGGLPAGLYIVKIMTNNASVTRKFIKVTN